MGSTPSRTRRESPRLGTRQGSGAREAARTAGVRGRAWRAVNLRTGLDGKGDATGARQRIGAPPAARTAGVRGRAWRAVNLRTGLDGKGGATGARQRIGAPPAARAPGVGGCAWRARVPPAGLEPATLCLEGRCSIRLSYGGLAPKIPSSGRNRKPRAGLQSRLPRPCTEG